MHASRSLPRGAGGVNTRAAGRGTTTAGIAATTDALTTVAAAGERGRQGTTRGVIYQPGSTLTKSATFPENRTTSVSRSFNRLQHGPVSSRWTVFRPAAGEPVVDRLQHRSSSSRRRKPSAHERTEHHVPPGTVDLPGLWTPAHRRAESGGRRDHRDRLAGTTAYALEATVVLDIIHVAAATRRAVLVVGSSKGLSAFGPRPDGSRPAHGDTWLQLRRFSAAAGSRSLDAY